MADPTDGIDFALAGFRGGEEWQVAPLAADVLGDLDSLTGLRLDAGELAVLPEDNDLYPDEMLADIADRLGFGVEFDDAVDLVLA